MKNAAIALLATSLLVACAHTSFQSSSVRFQHAPVFEPVAPASVVILRDAPARYVSVGEVRVEMRGLYSTVQVSRDPNIRAAIQNEAARLGADAVVFVEVRERITGRRPNRCCVQDPAFASHVVATAIRTGTTG